MQAKAVPLVCDSHFFYLFQIQRRRALNTHKKKKKNVQKKCKGLRHYIVWQPGKMPQPKSSCRKHSAQSHAWATEKWHHSFTCLTFHWQQAATRKKKQHTMTKAGAA